MSVIGRCVDEPLFTSDLILAFVYEMMILMSEHTDNSHNRGKGRWGGGG